MRTTQEWVPDTHPNLVIIEEHDTEDPTHRVCLGVFARTGQRGPDGEEVRVPMPDPQGLWARVRQENASKNVACMAMLEALPPECMKQAVDEDGDLLWRDAAGDVWSEFAPGELVDVSGATARLGPSFEPVMVPKRKFMPRWRRKAQDEAVPDTAVNVGGVFVVEAPVVPAAKRAALVDAVAAALSAKPALLSALDAAGRPKIGRR